MKKGKKKSEEAEDAAAAAGAAADRTEKMELLGEENDGGEGETEIRVAEKFAKKYNERKDKIELSRARRILEDEGELDDSDASTSEVEDETADLLTSHVDSKIFDTLRRIKSKDPSIYNKETVFFNDEDFKESETKEAKGGSAKPVRFKDFLRDTLLKDGADAIAQEEEALEAKAAAEKKRRKTPNEEQAELKAQMLAAAHGEEDGDDDEEDDLFSLKVKSDQDKKEEDDHFANFKFKQDREVNDGDDIMTRYWKADEDLDEQERFLRDYMMNKGWMDAGSLQKDEQGASDSEQEEEHLEKADEFEKDYNFRFEMEEGTQIQGHARHQVEGSVRERNDKRKRQRKEKAERQEAEKIRRTEEIKRLKNLKKQEIKRRLEQLQEVTGNEETALGAIDLDEEFDPDKHDKDMNKLLGKGFDEQEEALDPEELMQPPAGLEDLDTTAAAEESVKRRRESGKSGKQPSDQAENGEQDEEKWDEEAGNEEAADGDNDGYDAEEETDPNLWWLCDGCQKGIPAGKKRFDCTVCENFTLCVACFRIRRHPHKFVRRRVPDSSMPPADLKGQEAVRPDMQEMLDEYFNIDYEDIIGGDLPTRFKYRKVEKKGFGMSTDTILNKTDQELNRILPLKKLRTYRQDTGGAAWDPGESQNSGWSKKKDDSGHRGNSEGSHARKWKQQDGGSAGDARGSKGGGSSKKGRASAPAAAGGGSGDGGDAGHASTAEEAKKGPRKRGPRGPKKKRRDQESQGLTKQRLGAYNLPGAGGQKKSGDKGRKRPREDA